MLSDHDALRRAIHEHPDEDTPRLAFADLVEENDDPEWAAFIRTQVELARVPEWDPLWVKCRQLNPDAARGWAMAHTLPGPLPMGFDWRGHQFRRGFAWRATAHGTDPIVARAPELFALAPIQAIDFAYTTRPDLATLAGCPHLRRLRRLDFTQSSLTAADAARLGESPHAERLLGLSFEENAIDSDGLRALAATALFPRLTSLDLRKNVIPPALLVDALWAAPAACRLRRLGLPYCSITRYDADNLFQLPLIRELESLDLGDNPLSGDGIITLAESGAVRGLRVLELAKTLPGLAGVRALTEAAGLAGLRVLDLSANRLGPVAAQVLAASPGVRGLRVLRLGNNPLRDAGAVAIADSRNLAGLLELDLSDTGTGDAGALALAESPHLDGLLRLDLTCRMPGRPLADATRQVLRDRFGPRVSFNESPG